MNDSNSSFYSIQNMKNIITVFNNFLVDKYNIEPKDIKLNLKKEIFNIMERLRKNPLHKDMNLKELNKITLQTLRDIVKQNYLPNINIKSKENFLNRDKELYNKRQVTFTDNLNINENTLLNEQQSDNIIEQFERLNNERKEKSKEEIINEIINEKPTSGDLDQSMSQEDFQNTLRNLENNRNQLFDELGIETNNDEDYIQKNNKIELQNNYRNELMLSTTDFVNNRNQLMRNQLNDIQQLDPKEIYAQTEKIKNIEQNALVNKPIMDIKPSFPMIKRPTANTIKEKYVCINSMDRDWIVQQKRYSYMVKFNYVYKGTKKVEIYENNPTIPNTKSTLSDGIPNVSGYCDDTGIFRLAYNSSLPQGNIIGYETIEFLTDDNTNVQQNFKNIQSIEITKVVLPIDIAGAKTGRLYNFNLNSPYVLLHIEEFKDLYEGTNDTIRKSFCQLVYENTYQSSNGRGYVVLKPVQNEKKIFYPSLLSSMPSLNISLTTPNGDLLNDSIDGYSILEIVYEPFNKYYLKIITNRYFDNNEFNNGDKIIIKRYNAFKILEDQDSTNISNINIFINRDSGHEIIKIGDATDNSYFKSFYIRAPGSFSADTGNFTLEDGQIEDLIKFNCNSNTGGMLALNPINGYVLNMSLQNAISMKITTVNVDSVNLIPEMVN
jgi:hypothetical protein